MEAAHTHITPYSLLAKILIALLVLTSLTVCAAWLDFKQWTIVIAMIIACTKVSLVLVYFMHLKYEVRVFQWMAAMVFCLLVVIFVLLFFDYWFR